MLRFINCVKFNFGKVICHRIPIQTPLLLTTLPARQDDIENREIEEKKNGRTGKWSRIRENIDNMHATLTCDLRATPMHHF